MTTTLITGGAGFIGSHLADLLLARGERVVTLDNFNDYYDPALKWANVAHQLANPNFCLVEGDLRDLPLIQRTFDDHQPDRVAHLAAMAGVRYSIERAVLYTEVNITGSLHLLDAARAHNVQNFVQASTSSVYGKTDQIPFTEDQPTDAPLAPYPATKKANEVMGYAYHNMFGLNFTALRFFTVYGPRVRPDMMAYSVIQRALSGQKISLYGYENAQMQRDWTYVADIVAGVAAALDKPLGYQVINIGRGQPVLLAEFVRIIEELVGKQANVEHVPAPASEPPITFASIEKARALLGYEPSTSIREGLAHTWAWYQAAHQQST